MMEEPTSMLVKTKSEATFKNGRNQNIFYQRWAATSLKRVDEGVEMKVEGVASVLIFLHGIAEHSSRYEHVYQLLVEKNPTLVVYAMDHHGHGKSEGLSVYCHKFEDFVDDVNQFRSIIENQVSKGNKSPSVGNDGGPSLDIKYFLCGMSFGALIAAHVTLTRKHSWSGIILAAGAIGVEMTLVLKIQKAFSSFLSAVCPKACLVPAVRMEDMSKDPSVIKSYEDDPLIVIGNLRVRIGEQGLKAMNELDQRKEDFDAPLLVMHGTADKCTCPILAKKFHDGAGSSDKTFKSFEGLYHAIFHEPEKEEVMNFMESWIHDRITESPTKTNVSPPPPPQPPIYAEDLKIAAVARKSNDRA